MTPSHLSPIKSTISSTDKIVFFKWHIYYSKTETLVWSHQSCIILDAWKQRKNYLNTTTLVYQEIDPASTRHRFCADDSVFPIRVIHFNGHRFRHGREKKRNLQEFFCGENLETEEEVLPLKKVQFFSSVSRILCGLKSKTRSNGRFIIFMFCLVWFIRVTRTDSCVLSESGPYVLGTR